MQKNDIFLKSLYERSRRELKEANFSLDVVSHLKKVIESDFPSSSINIVIGGTNGKGSTATFLNSVLMRSGFKCGLFTSPHLISPRERVVINGEVVDESSFINAIKYIDKLSHREYERGKISRFPTFFEIIFLTSFYLFSIQKCEISIFEVGLGGRLDATNVLDKDISFITNVSLDHESILGSKLEEIALEKVAIFEKSNLNLVGNDFLYNISKDKFNVKKRSEVVNLVGFKKSKPFRYEFWVEYGREKLYFNPMSEGFYQVENILNSLFILHHLEKILEKKFVRETIVEGINETKILGRFQKISHNPDIYIDGAHNEAGLNCLSEEFKIWGIKPVVLFGAMRDKNILKRIGMLFSFSKEIAFLKVDNPRSADFEDYAKEIKNREFTFFEDVCKAIEWAKSRCGDSPIFIFGSLYLCGEILEKFEVCVG